MHANNILEWENFLIVDIHSGEKKFTGEYFIKNILENIYENLVNLRKNQQKNNSSF